MKMKQVIAIGLIGTMVAIIGTGCGSKNRTSNITSQTSEGKQKVTEIDFWYSGGKSAVNVLTDIVNEFNATQTTYKIKAVTQADYTETYEKLQAGIAGKKAPDMALLDVDKARNLSNKGLVSDLRGFIDSDKEFHKEDYLEVFFEQGYDKKGNLFAFPAYGTTQVMYYNIAAFEAANIKAESIKTWQDLEEAAKKMTRSDGSFYGWEPMWGPYNMVDAAFSNGAKIFSEDGKTVTINSKEWVEVFEKFRQWIHEDRTMKINFGGQGWEYWYKTIDDVLSNRAGGYTGSSGDQADLDFTKVAAMEQPGFAANPSAPTADALQLVMLDSSNQSEKQGVYEFMKYFTSPANQAKWSMSTGYVAVNVKTMDDPDFKAYTEKNPQALVPLRQAMHGSILPEDPTGGKIMDALSIAADKIEIEGVSAKEALDEAQQTAQAALNRVK